MHVCGVGTDVLVARTPASDTRTSLNELAAGFKKTKRRNTQNLGFETLWPKTATTRITREPKKRSRLSWLVVDNRMNANRSDQSKQFHAIVEIIKVSFQHRNSADGVDRDFWRCRCSAVAGRQVHCGRTAAMQNQTCRSPWRRRSVF